MQRRQFLHTTAAVAAASVAATASAEIDPADEAEPTRFKKAVKIGMVKVKGSLTVKFKLLKELGFDGVELNSPGGPSAAEVTAAVDASGLPVHGVVNSIHWRTRLSDPDEVTRAAALAGFKTALRAAKNYGATSMLLVPGKVTADATYKQCWSRSIAEVAKAIPLAEELGIEILLENVWNDFLTDPKETARYIDELESDAVGAYFDVGNAVRYSPPETWVPILGKRIRKLDIKEYSKEKGFRPKLMEGDVDWPKVISALKKIGYSGWATAEIPGGDAERLAEIAERMDKIFAS